MGSLGGFRAKAVLTLQSPEQLDRRIRLVGAKNWSALVAIVALLAGVGCWAALSSIPTTVSANGFVTPSAGWSGVEAPLSGTVQSMSLLVGTPVERGQVLAAIDGTGGTRPVLAAAAGYVAEVGVAPGDYVNAGQQLAIITPSSTSLVVRAFFPLADAEEIRPGAAADIALASVPSSAYGYVRGTVTGVAPLPATAESLEDVLQNPALVSEVEASGPVVEVVVTPEGASTPSGLRWTVGSGPGFALLSGGLPTHVSVTLYRQHPLQYVF
jgi:multidrug resistance efflux pump